MNFHRNTATGNRMREAQYSEIFLIFQLPNIFVNGSNDDNEVVPMKIRRNSTALLSQSSLSALSTLSNKKDNNFEHQASNYHRKRR